MRALHRGRGLRKRGGVVANASKSLSGTKDISLYYSLFFIVQYCTLARSECHGVTIDGNGGGGGGGSDGC